MQCPKCGHEQAGNEKCERCGIIFEKYRRYQEQREQRVQSSPSADDAPQLPVKMLAAVALGLLLVGAYFFFGTSDPPPVAVAPAGGAPPAMAPVENDDSGEDLAARLQQNTAPANAIESARNGTVFIQTDWGLGSGFFVNDSCSIVTNKHVIKLSEQNTAAAENEIRQRRNEADAMRLIINSNKGVLLQIKRGEARSGIPTPTIEAKIKEDEEKLAQLEQAIAEAESKLEGFKSSTSLSVILADGSKYDAYVAQVSDSHDLAVVELNQAVTCPAIPVGDPTGLHQGDRLYTIGSPMGIKHVVTSGIFSGHTEVDGSAMLQTDAPINPGNSGGPLINEAGQVVGINTMILKNAQGIGFAIPVTQALQDLNLSVP